MFTPIGANGHFSPGSKHSGSLLTPTFSRWGRLCVKSFLLVTLGRKLKPRSPSHLLSIDTKHWRPNPIFLVRKALVSGFAFLNSLMYFPICQDKNCLYYDALTYERVKGQDHGSDILQGVRRQLNTPIRSTCPRLVTCNESSSHLKSSALGLLLFDSLGGARTPSMPAYSAFTQERK